MRLIARTVMIVATMVLASRPLAAQSVIGSVVRADSITPVSGAIVSATDAAGAPIGRALTNARGEFALKLMTPGSATLTVLRIGFRPARGPTVDVATTATERVRIVVSSAAVTLASVGIREPETCRVSADTGLAVARVWEEARKAMLTSQLTGEDAPLFAEWIEYDRKFDSTARVVREQRVRTSRNPTTHAFRGVPAELLREAGFVVADDSSTTYYAPDAEALLSDVFVSGHCFHLVEPAENAATVIGVAFTPTRARRSLREIEGTLWVDRRSAELRSVEFRYLNLPDAATPAAPGGVVEFRRLDDGHWLVTRWNVRMPELARRERTSDNGLRRSIMARTPMMLRAVQVSGGEVLRATRGDSIVYAAVGASVAVQLTSPDAYMTSKGATLTLDGTDYTGTANDAGLIHITPVLAGRYRARLRTPLMSTLGLPAVSIDVEARSDARPDTLALPTATQALALVCPRDSLQDGEGLLHGTVRDEQARPIAGVDVTGTWSTGFSVLGTTQGDRLSYTERTLKARTDAAGIWHMCGVPRAAAVVLTAGSDSTFARQRAPMENHSIVSADLVLAVPKGGSGELAKLLPRLERALVQVNVTNDRGVALTDATLDVQPTGGAVRTIVTGSGGMALVPDVPFGPLTIRVRRVGFTPGEVALTAATERVVVPIVLSAISAPMLDTMRAVARRSVPPRLQGFEDRLRNKQATVSITSEEIEKRNPASTWQMLANLSSVRISVRLDEVVAVSTRTMISDFGMEPCFMRIVVDGIEMSATPGKPKYNLSNLLAPSEIHGIEVFAGPATIPVEFGGTGSGKWCGLIAIWTK